MSDTTTALELLVARLAETAPGLRVETGPGTTGPYAYDASNYRVPPRAVVFPRSAEDVVAVVRACREAGVPVTPRGGGTSMAGNAVGPGVVLDLSRSMNRILDIDAEARTARVEAGVVLDALRSAAALHGLTFGSDPSSHSRCTLGGMIGNDACGNRSVRDGRTGGHVEALEIVTADGVRAVADHAGLHPVDPRDAGPVARLEADVRRLIADNLGPIRTELGRIPRQVSGYQLQHLLPEHGFDMARALVGTEGSCAVVTAATVRLVATAQACALLTLGYDDVVDAAEDVPEILRWNPSAVEGMDEAIVATMRARRGPDSVTGLPEGRAWLYVELEGDDHAEVGRRAAELLAALEARGRTTGGRVVESPAERRSLWRVREDGAGLAARLIDGGESWPGWEDAAVAPQDLAAYLRDFRKLLASHELTGVLYGHFGAGCVHVRIDFDLATDAGRAATRRFLTEAAALVVEHGGTLSGEHGDGRARGELLQVMYSHRMIRTFAAFKEVFDPEGLLNPGVIVAPAALDADLALHTPSTVLPVETLFSFPHDEDGFAGAVRRCVGVGRCRSDAGGVMCPSYRATGEENASTRGRARLLQEMVRGGTVQDGWRSREVRDALDLCLSCKACSSDCPVGVDMATYKAEFLHQHYKGRLRPRSHYSLGWLPLTSRLVGHMARPVNALLRGPVGKLLARLGGVTTKRRIPAFASRRAVRRALRASRTGEPAKTLLFVDSFTRAFRPEVAGAASRVLADAGIPCTAEDDLCCGLTWVSTGQLSLARRIMARTVARLDNGDDRPVVVAEPSCAAALKRDVPELLGTEAARRVAARVHTLTGALTDLAAPGWTSPELPDDVLLQTHCHEYATFKGRHPRDLLGRLGVRKVDEAEGCCGLAGNFGFEEEHYDTSMAVADLALKPRLDGITPDTPAVVVADGFSCATQIDHLAGDRGVRALHLAELLDPAADRPGRPGENS
ncbi:FAD-binding and (Fe-S)-binding domain-containing protein [Streptomyces scabiei]|uniref:FAD-binding and (Fe-S)-binding domain-containing protein n=1 Tax=Streptomyces scabiei TaxID=1930 RepID=UPI001B3046A4|nr:MULTISPECIES: FAD-binding and (Fe-S)-binding domain-containing protein [Streptomyces]MBP5872294.1 FAD-binding oxidoreductase [Streptomyces sp. LBUM 1485]MBP5918461.1 FAD-binding oxidoreductase [Streptomyces sp. LBUM 1486]MDX3026335.1 FAD-binding and (Fe-S)-binding domain-containing protein [Streptomyces scabiei]MDX3205259.1 FAD-binding and (Fe-S)-binding domain-containing protein [Streptomyces scabiei]QTU52468.1 FAD-binding oxidoreductase [Streptomyces sp. LBUM 1480]